MMDLNRLKTWVAARNQKHQEQSGTVTQDEIVTALKPLYDAKIAAGLKARAAVEELQKELAEGGIEVNLALSMFKKAKNSGFDLGDKPPLRVVIWAWQAELRAMSRRGWSDVELVQPVRERVKKERPDLAEAAEKEITEAAIHEIIAKKRSTKKSFLPDNAARPVADLVSRWRGQIKRLVKRGWTVPEIVKALQAKVRVEYKEVDPDSITTELVQCVIESGKNDKKDINDAPSSSVSIEELVAPKQPPKSAPVKLENIQEWREKDNIVILKDIIPVKAKTRIITESGKIAEVVSCKPTQYGSGFSKKDGMEVFYKIIFE